MNRAGPRAWAVWLGIRSSGRERTHASAVEQRLRERTFTGQDRVTLEWPRDRRRPSLAKVVSIGEEMSDLVVALTGATRGHQAVSLPASPRASLALAAVARAAAMMDGRDFVTPTDIKRFVEPVLAHRLGLTADARLRGQTPAAVLNEIVEGLSMGVRDAG